MAYVVYITDKCKKLDNKLHSIIWRGESWEYLWSIDLPKGFRKSITDGPGGIKLYGGIGEETI